MRDEAGVLDGARRLFFDCVMDLRLLRRRPIDLGWRACLLR